ncbi:Vacuolar protein sorting-associated protein 13C [Chlorella vulgaris]
MFEGYVVYYLNQYLGKYVDGIDQKSLSLSIYKGDVVLRNLQLKADALEGLDLPVTVRAGLLGSLTLKVPWSSLGTVPVEAKIDRLYLLASPKTEEERGKGVKTEEELEPAFQAAKKARVEAQEKHWVQEMEAMAEQQEKMAASAEGKDKEKGGVGGMFKAVIDTVIGNLQLSISNVHIRYEDALTNPEHPFACGITLDRISGYTALLLRRMSVYFDTDAEFWQPIGGANWHDLAPPEWDEWFQPGIGVDHERDGTARHRQYVLQPVDGNALYTRHGYFKGAKEGEPLVDIDFQLDVVALRLSQWQYQSYHLLLSEVSSFTARLAHIAYRPLLRPAAGKPARLWWRYAIKAVQQQRAARKLSWNQAISYARMRVEYVPAYAAYLRSRDMRAAEELRPPKVPQAVQDMDLALPEKTILMFRRLAHAKYQRERRRKAAQVAAESKAKAANSWMGWLRGASATPQSQLVPGAQDAAPELTPEEYSRLVELVTEQEQGLRDGSETPFTMLTRVGARVGSASALLVGADDTQVLRGGLEGIHLTLAKYPETVQIDLGVAAMGVESPEGTFLRTGAQMHRLRSDTDLSDELEAGANSKNQRALVIAFVQKPQDGSADALLDVILTPSYVYYSATAIDRVVNFFKTPDELDFSTLSAQATTQLERARRLASQYAAAALQSRPKLKLHLQLDAPKVAIPAVDAKGRATLALDFGRFVIESDFKTQGMLPAEEAALYECVRLNVANVSAYVVDGEFDWQKRDDADAGQLLIPLLERTGMDIAMQAARFLDPKYPVVRLQPTIPRLHFYLSPGRIARLLRVVRAAFPSAEDPAGGVPTTAAGAQELWREHADHQGDGKLYLYEGSKAGAKLAAAESVWTDRRVMRVPPDSIGGVEHVVALCPEGQDLARIAESTSCVLLRLESHQAADKWYRSLQQAQQSMQELAADGAAMLPPDWEEASSTVSGPDAEESAAALASAQASGATCPVVCPAFVHLRCALMSKVPAAAIGYQSRRESFCFDECAYLHATVLPTSSGVLHLQAAPQGSQAAPAGQAPSIVVQVEAQLGELAIFGSGREPSPWWPSEEEVEVPESATGDRLGGHPVGMVNVDGEVALIVLRASGGTCRLTYGAPGMTGVEPVGEDVFFDAEDRLASGGSQSPRGGLSPAGSTSLSTRGPLTSGAVTAQDLAEFTFKMRQPGSSEYEGVDTSLDVSLSSLYFYCNRPTVAALITMGLDVSAAASSDTLEEPGTEAGLGAGEAGEAGEASGDAESEVPTQVSPEIPGAAAVASAVVEGVMAGLGVEEAGQLLGALEGDRSMFRLTACLGTLQVLLNYEGSACATLSQASVDDFTFSLDVKPDTSMHIKSTLGNVRAVDCTLPVDHPYHLACGLRSGSSTSLVSLNFSSFPPSHPHPAVPAGLQYYTLQAQLSELQLVFLYRFLQENLTYISTMLAMRPLPVESEASPAPNQSAQLHSAVSGQSGLGVAADDAGAPSEGVAGQVQVPLQPTVLLLDVKASAPIICLPRHSGSMDSIEVDLGKLSLKTTSILSQAVPTSKQPLLVEAVSLCFSGVGCSMVQDGKRGNNVFQNAESGWQLRWRRPLQLELRGDLPTFDLSLEVPFLKASLTDHEFQLITSVASDNFAEEPEVPAGADWITDHYQAILLEQQQALLEATQLEQQQQMELMSGDLEASHRAASGPAVPGAAAAAKNDKSPSKVRVVVSLGEVELELHRHLEGLPHPLPLARFTVASFWVAYRNSEEGSMFVAVNVPRVEARDLRPEVPLEQSLVISSGHKASFLMLDWAAGPGMTHQALGMTLQKPLLVAELSFLLAITQFVVPTFAFVKDRPIPWVTHDVALSGKAYVAEGDLYLCPAVRLLADSPGVTAFEYQGNGHRLVLPDKGNLDEPLPLILVGSGCTLRLRNVKVVNAASLAVCLQLAPGAQLLATPEDGVELVDNVDADAELARQLAGSPTASSAISGSMLRTLSPRKPLPRLDTPASEQSASARRRSLQLAPAMSSQPSGAPQATLQPKTIEMVVSAVGLGLQFVHLDSSSKGSQTRLAGSAPGSAAGSRHGSVPPLSARRPEPSGRAVQLLSASLDLSLALKIEDDVQSGHVEVQGLRAETRFVSDAAARLAHRDQSGMDRKRKMRGTRESSVLDPCRLVLDFKLAAGGTGLDATPACTDIKLDTSELRLTLSPDVLELGSALASSALAPLMQPKPDAPLTSCTQFERVWSFDPAHLFAGQQSGVLAVSLAVTGAEGGVTVWRAKTPTGYGVTGDIVTPGTTQASTSLMFDAAYQSLPTFEVLVVAVNSGLAAFPTSYVKLWMGGGGTIWRPQPPPGYVAAGDLFSVGDERPELSAMVCLHERTVVNCSPGERLTLPPQLPHAPAVTAQAAASLPHVELWCMDNSLGSFWAATSQHRVPPGGFDLRSPLGITPAALLAMGAVSEQSTSWATLGQVQKGGEAQQAAIAADTRQETAQDVLPPPVTGLEKRQDARQMFKTFESSRRELRTEAVARLVTPSVVDFRRIWDWEGDSAIPCPEGYSIWRPLPPAGYVSVGDCMMKGHDPPPAVCVVQDTSATEGLAQEQGQPLVKGPRGFEPVWEDSTSYADSRLVLWTPIPYPGYVAMGCVATIGTVPPPRTCVKCLRADAACKASLGRTPLWLVRKDSRSLPPLAAWTVDDKLRTFAVAAAPADGNPPPPKDVWKLRQPSSEEAPPAQQAATGVNVVVKAAQASVLLQDPFHIPLLEVCLGAVEAGVRGASQQVVQAYLGFKLGVWGYNGAVRFWEPVLEPWDVIAQCAANQGTRMASGIEPGINVSIKTSNDCVYSTLAYSSVSSALAAYSDWQQLHAGGGEGALGLRSLLAMGEGSAMHVQVDNRLGVEAAMELDFGDRLDLVTLGPGSTTPVVKPLPSFPLRQDSAVVSADALPHNLLLLDIQQAMCAFAAAAAGAAAAASSDAGAPSEATGAASKSGSSGNGGTEQGRQIYCTVHLGDAGSTAGASASPASRSDTRGGSSSKGFRLSADAPVRTRALALGDGGLVAWQERLILALPMRLGRGEQVLVCEIWDAAARGGRGASLGRGTLSVPHRQQQDAELTWQAGGRAGEVSVQLQLSYMLQVQWPATKLAASVDKEGAADLSTAGQRALSLSSQPGAWAVIPAFGQNKAKAGTTASKSSGSVGSTGKQAVPDFVMADVARQSTGWVVLLAEGHLTYATAAGSASVTPIKIGKEGLVVESSVANGTRREVLRALCQLVNSTELTLEACLVDVEDGDWSMVPSRSGKATVLVLQAASGAYLGYIGVASQQGPDLFFGSRMWMRSWLCSDSTFHLLTKHKCLHAGTVTGTFSADSVEEEVLENERFARGGGGSQWSAGNLQAGEDPRHFEFALQQADSFPQVDPPSGWEWESSWQIDHGPTTDGDGWAYGPDFKRLHFPPPAGSHKPSLSDYVRRRRWVRRRRRVGGSQSSFPVASTVASAASKAMTALGGQQSRDEEHFVVKERQVLGQAAPGEALPLPLGWSAPGKQLQLRPVLSASPPAEGKAGDASAAGQEDTQLPAGDQRKEAAEGQLRPGAVHDWSRGTSNGQHTIALDSLDEGITRLVCCRSKHNTPMGSASELEMNDLWFSLSVDSDMLAGSKQSKPLTDWRVVVTAPLRLTNQLPVTGSLLVWEQQQANSQEIVGRQTVQVPSGETVSIHTVDMRKVVSFSFYPEGYDWVEPTPAILSEGCSGTRGSKPLPDRFRLQRASASVPVEVFIHRTIELGTWLLDATEELDPGTAAAMGVPLAVALLSPLWVVNATSLAIDAAIVAMEEAPPIKQAAGPLRAGASRRQAGKSLRDASLLKIRAEYRGRRFVGPSSMELLSYPLPSYLAQQMSHQQLPAGTSAEQQAQRQRQQRRQQYGVRLRVAGSGWTPAMALDAAELSAAAAGAGAGGAAAQQQQEGDLQAARPVLIRALCREFSVVHEVVMRLEMLRLEPHVVISNRTSVPLQLLQSRLELVGVRPGGAPPAGGRPSGAVVALGGTSFSQTSRNINAAPMASGGSFLVRPSMASQSSVWQGRSDDSTVSSHPVESITPSLAAESFTTRASSWEAVPASLLSGASPLVQMSASSFREQQERGAVLDLPDGASSVPLPLSAGLPSRSISFRCVPPPEYAAAAAADSLPLWSRPVTVQEGVETQLHVLVPVVPADEQEDQQARPGAEAGAAGDAAHLTASAATAAQGTGIAARARATGSAAAVPSVAILRLSMHRRGPGALHIVLESMHSEPPYVLENRTRFPLQYRQAHVPAAPFHTLEPHSASGYVWEYSMIDAPLELEMQEAAGSGVSRLYALDAPQERDGESTPEARNQPLPLSALPNQCSVRVAFWQQVLTSPTGVQPIPGEATGVLGRGGIDRVLLLAPGHEPLLTEGAKSLQPALSDISVSFQLPGLEVSVVDHQSRELLLLTATDLHASVAFGSNPATAYKSVRFSVQRLQLDDMLPGTPFPVVLAAAPQQPGKQGGQPMLAVTVTSVVGGPRGRSYMPLVAVRRLAISEGLVWSVQELVQRLQANLAGAGEGGAAVAAADVPVRIRLLTVDSLKTQISFQGDPFSRPRDLTGGLLSSIIDLANFQAAPISLQGLSESDLNMLQSALTSTITHHIRSQLFYVTLSLMRNFGLMGGTSRALGALSAAVSKLATGGKSAAAEQDAKQKRNITDVGDGVLEGAGAIGSSMLRGFRGLIEKPLQGAKKAGVEAEGFDATFGKTKEQLLVVDRRRPARLITGEGKLLPLVRDGSTMESRTDEIGQALLRNTLLSAPDALRRKRTGSVATEAYEDHFMLPDDRVLLLTSASILLVHAPGFTQLEKAAEIGAIHVSDVAPGEVVWSVRWDDVLTFELRWSREMHYPDRIVEEESLAHEIRCFEDTPQAPQVKLEAQKVLRKYYLDPLRRNQMWSQRHDSRGALPAGTTPDQLPLHMPCLDFVLTWHTNLKKQPVVSFWKPLPPAGYRAVGDVLALGLEPPAAPVPCFRDDAGLHIRASKEQAEGEPPLSMRPKEFSLIWRHNGKRPVTVWMPVAPPGYTAVGAVVRGEPEAPATEDYLCIRSDLTAPTLTFNSAIWKYDPLPALQAAAAQLASGSRSLAQLPRQAKAHHPETWKVDNRMGTFIAMRSHEPPPAGVPRTIVSIEERAASRLPSSGPTAPPS